MSWGTYYKHEGYLSHIGKNQVELKLEETKEDIERLWQTILSYMAATPPALNEEDEYKEQYPEFLVRKLNEIRQEMEESIYLRARLLDCKEAMDEHPDDVTEG